MVVHEQEDSQVGMKYQIAPEYRAIVVVGIGHVAVEEEMLFYKNLLAEPAFNNDYSFLIDYTRKEDELISADDIWQLAKFSNQQKTTFSTRGKVAVITPRDLAFGLARMHQAYAKEEDPEYRLFRDEEGALKWLGIPMSLLEEVRSCPEKSLG